MAGTTGLYFRALTQDETNALRARLNHLAGDLSYVAHSGPTTGENRGVLAHLLVGVDAGEVAVVKLTDEQRTVAIIHLDGLSNEWASVIAAALRAALVQQFEAGR